MSQKTILSFFKASDQDQTSSKETKRICVVEEKPAKKSIRKRKVKCIESDDESSDLPNKKLNGESSKTETPCDQKEKSSVKISKEEKNDVKTNGDISSGKTSEEEDAQNKEKTDSPQSPSKSDKEDFNQDVQDKVTDVSEGSAAEPSPNDDIPADFVQKRKTARKQMTSSRSSKKSYVVPAEFETETANKENVSKVTDESKTKERENKKVPSKKSPKNAKTPAKSKSRNTSKEDGSSSSKDVGENINEHESKETEADDTKNVVSKSEAEEDAGKKIIVKVSPKSVKKSDTKRRVTVTNKGEGSPSKKSAKVASIHNFFAPKKPADGKKTDVDKKENNIKLEDEEGGIGMDDKEKDTGEEERPSTGVSEKMEVDNDDSPVKKAPRKKTRYIESDDDDAEDDIASTSASVATVDTSLKQEVDDNEKSDLASEVEKKKDNKSSATTVSKDEKDSSMKLSSENSNTDKEKQKLSVKSTAADAVYNPSKVDYHPIDDAIWKRNEKVPYLALAKTLEYIENTSGRLKTIEILANFFRSVMVLTPDDFLHSVYLCLNRVAPEYEGIEMGVGETLLMKAVAQATGRTVEKIKAEVAVKGDLGLVSESSRGNQRVMFAPPKLTVSAVFNKFLEIAKMSGNSAMAKKTDKIKGLFVACRDCEAKYIIRSLSGKLRIGLAEQSVLSSIARAAVLTPPGQDYPPEKINMTAKMSSTKFKDLLDSQTLILKTAYCECPNYDLIVPVLLKEGISALPERCQLSPGVPLKPMLAHPTAGVDMVLARFDKNAYTCEFKYDGERAQIHMNDKGEVKIFSRNQEDNTSKYPDIISRLPESVKETTKSFILDSEAVAFDTQAKQILPFQVLSTRKRKDAKESEITVQVCVMVFDLLYLNGESLVKKPLKERRSLLQSSFTEIESKFMFAQYRDGDTAETMQEFLDESVKGNCEGLMVKALEVDASYEIAKRSHNWLKLKKDYLQGIGDTLDLVVIGGYYGKGKRTGSYGGFLLACYEDENEEFQSICKLGTGFKDDDLETHTKFLKQRIIKEPKAYYQYDHGLEPDDWFEPVQVWEIKCADLSVSPVHKAAIGIVDPKRGISLRFPRFIRIRDDKSVEDATNSTQIADMYQKQQQIQNTSSKNLNNEEDYY